MENGRLFSRANEHVIFIHSRSSLLLLLLLLLFFLLFIFFIIIIIIVYFLVLVTLLSPRDFVLKLVGYFRKGLLFCKLSELY